MDKKVLTISSTILKIFSLLELLAGFVFIYLLSEYISNIGSKIILSIINCTLFLPSFVAGFKSTKYLEGKCGYYSCMVIHIWGIVEEYVFMFMFGKYIFYPYLNIAVLVLCISPLIINILGIKNIEKLRNPHIKSKKNKRG